MFRGEWLLFHIFLLWRHLPANHFLGFLCLFLLLQEISAPAHILIAPVPYHMQFPQQKGLQSSLQKQCPRSTVCVCSEDGNDYHKRRKKDYVRNSLQICTLSKPSCFALQNHIVFCSSSVAVWCWSWICERLGSKSAMFTNTGGMSARDGQIQIWSLWFSKWLVIWLINRKHGFWLCKVFPTLRALTSVIKSNHSSALQVLADCPLPNARVSA